MVALLAPGYNDLAFKAAQPAVFAELAVMLWLMTIGVRAPATDRLDMPAAARVTAIITDSRTSNWTHNAQPGSLSD